MTNPDPTAGTDAGGIRVAADPEAAAASATRLAEAVAELAAVRSELSALLFGVDAAIGAGGPAGAFRTGFVPAGGSVAEALRATEGRLEEQRRTVVAGVDTLVGADAEVSARIGRADAR
ncbi:hypothetical protein ACLTEW_15230 [Gordonia lacunae]|uniref:hypothetical protein n=1 Tax=Gordonia lacunae TaxID=417102 RepID=UPI0039E468A8